MIKIILTQPGTMQTNFLLSRACMIAMVIATVMTASACKPAAQQASAQAAQVSQVPQAQQTQQAPAASLIQVDAASAAISHAPTAATYSGPFGLAMAISETELASTLGFVKSTKGPHLFEGQPPAPLAEFSDYFAVTAPISGICKLGASRSITAVSGTGEQIKAAADRIAQALEQQYGKPSFKKDKVKTDLYSRRPQFWMVGLKEGSVSYGYLWANGKTEHELPDNILNIIVFAQAHAINRGEVGVSYEFANYADCQKEWRKEKGRKS